MGSWHLERFKTTGTAHENALHRLHDVNTDIHSLSYKKEEEKDTTARGLPLLRTAGTIIVTLHPPCIVFVLCLFLARQPPMGQGLLIHEVSRSHTTHHSRQDSPGRVISPSHRSLPDNTHNKHPCPRWDSNRQSQQASGRRPTP